MSIYYVDSFPRYLAAMAFGLALANQACSLSTKTDAEGQHASGGASNGTGGGVASGGAPVTDPGFNSKCIDQTGICSDCLDFTCGGPALDCGVDATCAPHKQTLTHCVNATCDFAGCFATFAASDVMAKALNDCVSTKCSVKCSGNAPIPTADGGSGGTASNTNGGAGGSAGGVGDMTGFCKEISDECTEGISVKCGTQAEACGADATCAQAGVDYQSCLLQQACSPSCRTTLKATGALAQALTNCVETQLTAECL